MDYQLQRSVGYFLNEVYPNILKNRKIKSILGKFESTTLVEHNFFLSEFKNKQKLSMLNFTKIATQKFLSQTSNKPFSTSDSKTRF